MPRFYVPNPTLQNGFLKIEGEEVKHIRKVLRLRAGDKLILFNGLGKEYEGTIIKEGSSSVLVKVQNISLPQKDSPLEVTLAQSLLKGEKMDFLIRKATELGVKRIIPFLSSRSVPFLEKSKRPERHHRWERIAVEASKQCGRGVVPRIEPLKDYSEMLQIASPGGLRFILWEREGVKLREVLEKSKEKTVIFFVVGPEGGFGQEEVDEAERSGFTPVTLGRRVLRAETASLCLLSILQYERGDIG
jgi:16S rRNA (uracil1498-N3)-methyltransferase